MNKQTAQEVISVSDSICRILQKTIIISVVLGTELNTSLTIIKHSTMEHITLPAF